MKLKLGLGFALLVGSSANLFAQTNTGAIITDGDDVFAWGAQVVNGVPVTTIGLPTSSTAGGNVATTFNVGQPTGSPRKRYIFSGNWFYRLDNDSRERHGANYTSKTFFGPNWVEYRFNTMFGAGNQVVPGLSAKMGFQLTDTGPNSARLYTYFCIMNMGSVNVTANTFAGFDIDADGSPLGDLVNPLITTGAYKRWHVQDAGCNAFMTGPGAVGAGAGDASNIMGSLTNGTITNYNPDLNPGGVVPQDNQEAMQFFDVIPPGQEICYPMYFDIGINNTIPPMVPEPATMLALGGGLLVLLRKRRNRS